MESFLPASALENLIEVVYDRPGAGPEPIHIPHVGTFSPGVPTAIPRKKAHAITAPGGNRWMRIYLPPLLENEQVEWVSGLSEIPSETPQAFEDAPEPTILHEEPPEILQPLIDDFESDDAESKEAMAPEKSGALNISKKARKK